MDFLSRQKKLQAEAKLALAMAKPMAKMQVEVEKQNRKKSPVADLVSNDFIYFCVTPLFTFNAFSTDWLRKMGCWFRTTKIRTQTQRKMNTHRYAEDDV